MIRDRMDTAAQSGLAMESGETPDILLVEDDLKDAELTIWALSQCGVRVRVEHVTDGVEAIEYITSTGRLSERQFAPLPKMVLLDLKLNAMSGLQVLKRLKADERTRGIPIIILTSSRIAIELAESYKLGVNSYVLKPNDIKKFAEVVAEIGHYWLTVNEPPPL